MLFLDVNVCLYAFRPTVSERSREVAAWLDARLGGPERVLVSESVLASMIRIATHPRIFEVPASPADAVAFVDALLRAPRVVVVRPGPGVWPIFRDYVGDLRLTGNDVADAYLAATAVDAGAGMVTSDRGFTRFPGLRVIEPVPG